MAVKFTSGLDWMKPLAGMWVRLASRNPKMVVRKGEGLFCRLDSGLDCARSDTGSYTDAATAGGVNHAVGEMPAAADPHVQINPDPQTVVVVADIELRVRFDRGGGQQIEGFTLVILEVEVVSAAGAVIDPFSSRR